MKKILLGLSLVGLIGCQQPKPNVIKEEKTNNNEIKVEVLFTDEDGFTVKRFFDEGHYRYYVTPGPADAGGGVTIQQGKARITKTENVPTARSEAKP